MAQASSIPRGPLPPGIRLEENVYVTMRDGVKISVDIYSPEEQGRCPAILSISPYLKELQQWPPQMCHSIEAGATALLVPKGYVHVIANMRGTGLSQGRFNYLGIEDQRDGYDLIEWIAEQAWCTGNVGMLGESQYGRIQYLVAAQQPPHLKCIVPYDAGTDRFRDTYRGGVMNAAFYTMWAFDTMQQALWPGPVEGKLPPANLLYDWATHPEDGPYWWERSPAEKVDAIKVPMLAFAIANGPTHSESQLRLFPQWKVPKRLIILPPGRDHVFFLGNKPLNELIARWFDHWLKGIDTGIMDEPPIALCDGVTREWRYEQEYPLARTKWTNFYLRTNPNGPATSEPYGLISLEQPGNENPDSYRTPDCVPQAFAGKPVLGYASAPLEKDLTVWGPISMTLYGSSTTLDTIWFARVGEIAPDGSRKMLTHGVLKASFRELDRAKSRPGQPMHTYRNPVRPQPGTIYAYEILMIPIFHTFKAGQRIWIQIASHDLSHIMFLHTTYTAEMLPVPAVNTVYHDSAHASHLLLPVIPEAPIIRPVEPSIMQL
jgi:predicted acyl esterase